LDKYIIKTKKEKKKKKKKKEKKKKKKKKKRAWGLSPWVAESSTP